MSRTLHYAKAINMLSLWATPAMWQDKSLFIEIKALTDKLTTASLQLSQRELFLAQELTTGLIEATLASMNKADDCQYHELVISLQEITQFQTFLLTTNPAH